ncbi:lysosomal acid lipase/cholesteryl ester hydrolase protein [Dioscorea alata]|uniref:Lysosomal acid lipase/cholesteryl ester hydrolase protein n=1 Tax=Dioscorea alata TaxID=55571 RepID=A0ACB7UIA3_DIOAL|nr:lysosomal acid lipase/cholesteryl ester hydrolase protein [Dioscorea alata]
MVFLWFSAFLLTFSVALGVRDVGFQHSRPVGVVNGTCKTMVEIYSYPCEEHTVTTEDGYILSIQRIPNGHPNNAYSRANKIPVLLEHGLLMDGITWILNPPSESLGFILADKGYDVWIANARGTKYSSGHTSLQPNDSAYWDWSWDELTAYDLPATVKYIYNKTAEQKLHYVGHSLGTLIALASFCENEMMNMFRSAALLSPIAYVDQVASVLVQAAAKTFVAEASYWLGLHEFNPNEEAVQNLLKNLCKQPGVNCYDLMSAITGKNCCLNASTIALYQEHEPQPTATKNMIHLAQMIRKGTITKFDYGNKDENMKHYGRPTPPAYNMASIPKNFPMFIAYGGKDELSDVQDVKHLLKILKFHNTEILYQENYAHSDFQMAVNAKEVIYEPLMAFFKLH